MSKQLEIKRFVNEVEPLAQFELNNNIYQVFDPNDLAEKYYINYFSARAEIIDLANQYKESLNTDEVVEGLLKNIELQNLLIAPVKKMIEAITQVEEFNARPKVLMEIYNYIETLLNPIEEEGKTGNEQEVA